MPCRGPSPEEEYAELRRETRHKVDELTRLLCDATAILAKNKMLPKGDLMEWKNTHDEFDRKRREKIAKEAVVEATSTEVVGRLHTILDDLDPAVKAEILRKLR